MYSQNMSDLFARSVHRTVSLKIVACLLRGNCLMGFSAQDKLSGFANYQFRKSAPLQWLPQHPAIHFAIKTLSHIQQTQHNFRHPVAYSFSGANFL